MYSSSARQHHSCSFWSPFLPSDTIDPLGFLSILPLAIVVYERIHPTIYQSNTLYIHHKCFVSLSIKHCSNCDIFVNSYNIKHLTCLYQYISWISFEISSSPSISPISNKNFSFWSLKKKYNKNEGKIIQLSTTDK